MPTIHELIPSYWEEYKTRPGVLEKARERSREWYQARRDDPAFKELTRQRGLKNRADNPSKRLYWSALGRAKERNVPFDIVPEDIKVPDVCPVFKVPMELRTPYAPSLDRIDSSKGYVRDNIQVLSRKANLMKQDATKEELKRFAEWINTLQT